MGLRFNLGIASGCITNLECKLFKFFYGTLTCRCPGAHCCGTGPKPVYGLKCIRTERSRIRYTPRRAKGLEHGFGHGPAPRRSARLQDCCSDATGGDDTAQRRPRLGYITRSTTKLKGNFILPWIECDLYKRGSVVFGMYQSLGCLGRICRWVWTL